MEPQKSVYFGYITTVGITRVVFLVYFFRLVDNANTLLSGFDMILKSRCKEIYRHLWYLTILFLNV